MTKNYALLCGSPQGAQFIARINITDASAAANKRGRAGDTIFKGVGRQPKTGKKKDGIMMI